jgi:hypothetical protein
LICGLPNVIFFGEPGVEPLGFFVGVPVTLPWVCNCNLVNSFVWVARCACAAGAWSAAAAERAIAAVITPMILLFMNFGPLLSLVHIANEHRID